MRLFGTNGIRGVIGEDFTPDFLAKIGMAIGTYLSEGSTVIAGRDPRVSGDMVQNAVISGLLSTGIDVIDIGIAPTPAVQLYTKNHGDFGLIITASHNPPRFNGVKAIAGDGTELSRNEERKIEDIYQKERFRIVPWDRTGIYSPGGDANSEYVRRILDNVNVEKIKNRKFKVAIDCANGASSLTSPYLLEELGVKVVSLNCQPDGRFPGHESEPKPENLNDLMILVKEGDFDLGVAHDGDADRVIFVDEKGNFIPGDKSLALVAKYILENGDIIVTPVSSSMAIEEIAKMNGAKVVYTKVGAPIVARKMIEVKAKFGGEENGGMIIPEMQYCRDGAMGLAKVLEIMASTGKNLSELINDLPQYHQGKISVPCANNKKDDVLKELEKEFSEENTITIDGVKIVGENWWVLIRPSGTEPIYRIYAEAKTKEKLEELIEKYRKILEEIIQKF